MDLHGQVAVITLNRPEVGNAFNEEVRHRLPELLEGLDKDDRCAAILLCGAGERGCGSGRAASRARRET